MRARVSLAMFGSIGALLVARPVAAQTFGYDDRWPYETRQNFAIELRVGSFNPAIDAEFGSGAGPYDAIFNHGLSSSENALARSLKRLQFGLEFDWQAVRLGPVMSLGLGFSAGYASVSNGAPISASMVSNGATPSNTACLGAGGMPIPAGQPFTNPDCWTRSTTTTTSLHVVPTTLVAVARFDGLARHVRYLPLVPYAKLGLAYSIWWIFKGDRLAHLDTTRQVTDPMTNVTRTETVTGSDAIGGSLGWHGALGLSLMLDAFEPHAARQFDAEAGVNHSYVFFEMAYTDLAGFGSRSQLNVGGLNFVGGLAMEF